jgi:DNA-binding NtrC family response regulator
MTFTRQVHSVQEASVQPLQPYTEIYRLDVLIRTHVLFVLKIRDGNRAKAASDLGIARSTLYRMLRDYRLPLKHDGGSR